MIKILEFTDPICTWCLGSQAVLTKLEYLYDLDIDYIMGGLVKDITAFSDTRNKIGGDPKISNDSIHAHWLEASSYHKMPVSLDSFNLFSEKYTSSYPQNIAYKTAYLEDRQLAHIFLRRLRRATASQNRLTNRFDVLVEIAKETGLNIELFKENYKKGEAEFLKDLDILKKYAIRSFPSFLIKYNEKEYIIRGYRDFYSFEKILLDLNPKLKRKEKTDIYEFLNKYQSVSSYELINTFELSQQKYDIIIGGLDNLKYKTKKEGNGYFIEVI